MTNPERHQQGRLIHLKIENATGAQRRAIREAQQRVSNDPWYRTGGFHEDVNAFLCGYHVRGDRAYPVYRTNTNYVAVENHPQDRRATSFHVSEADIYFLR